MSKCFYISDSHGCEWLRRTLMLEAVDNFRNQAVCEGEMVVFLNFMCEVEIGIRLKLRLHHIQLLYVIEDEKNIVNVTRV